MSIKDLFEDAPSRHITKQKGSNRVTKENNHKTLCQGKQ